jgi:integrase
MTMHTPTPKGVRQTRSGTFELTLYHALIPGGRVNRNFATPEAAGEYKTRSLEILNKGYVPAELLKGYRRHAPATNAPVRRKVISETPVATSKIGSTSPLLPDLLQQYMTSDTAQISKTDRDTLETLKGELQGRLDGVKTMWVDAWVRHMKRELQLAPGTIRKKVESLARCIDWWNRQTYQTGDAPPNILRLMPKGYSSYGPEDTPKGVKAPEDRKRDRRLGQDEHEEIEAVLQGKHREGKQRPFCIGGDADFLMFYRLIILTGMRLREAYRLRTENIRFGLQTIYVPDSKTGASRNIPISPELIDMLQSYTEGKKGIVFPYWNGSNDEDYLDELTNQLSRRFKALFVHCGCEDLVEHDLRHEATCRWMEMRDEDGGWMFRSEEVQIITGHESVQQFKRYVSMRGSELAARMYKKKRQ